MLKGLIRQIAVVVTTVSVLIMNALANSLPLNGLTTGEISARFPVLFTPAGYVFSIWSVIYIGLIAYTVYQALPAQRDSDLLDTVGWLYVASGVLNIIWLLLWHYLQIALTFPVMALLLVTLIAIYARLGVGIRDVPAAE
ncbi:MAG: TspO/MBR family protein [Anaerolineae bacterium]